MARKTKTKKKIKFKNKGKEKMGKKIIIRKMELRKLVDGH